MRRPRRPPEPGTSPSSSTDVTSASAFDWVPEIPRGYVRDLRLRWALEEAGFPYEVETTPFRQRGERHFRHQPFGQVPWLSHDGLSIFESGACLLYIGERSDLLMPADPAGRVEVTAWLFAALNSVEMAVLPFTIFCFSGDAADTAGRRTLDRFLEARLGHMEDVLEGRDWLTASFSIADVAMADVLRLADRFDALASYPACRAYVSRAEARPAFARAFQDQASHFAASD